jgi:peptide chain release factor 1
MPISELIPMYHKAQAEYEQYQKIEQQLGQLNPADDPQLSKKLGRQYAALRKIVELFQAAQTKANDLMAAQELVQEDASFSSSVTQYQTELDQLNERLAKMLNPQDPDDPKDIIMEIKAGTGGEESALFVSDLFRMYSKYAESRGWTIQVFDINQTGIGGLKNIEFSMSGPADIEPEMGVWASMKYEGGVHRVQRVPVTESSGRIHTSAAGVYVFPELENDDEIDIDPQDLRIDVFRSSGPGGQSVNTTDSAVRITHIPTGIVVSMQNEKSQTQNKVAAMSVLKSRLLAQRKEEEAQKESSMRHSQVRTADRSEKIRTYNFPENRIVDHRTNYKAYNLDKVLDGDLQPLVDAAVKNEK